MGTKVIGAGNTERFEYWLNSFKFNKATIETALAVKELDSLMAIAASNTDQQKSFVEDEVIPKRIALAKSWTKMTNLMLAKFTTTGELGNLANLEMHSMKKLEYLNGHDAEIEKISGKALPEEARLAKEYQGADRILVFTNPSLLQKEDAFHVRVRVLSNTSEIQAKMYWRNFGEEKYHEIPLDHMARNVFEVKRPVSEFGDDFEYYFSVMADEKSLTYPATAENINCSVIIL
jgi:hypothetical protein